jgi:ribulose-phosphate 3-epimerase
MPKIEIMPSILAADMGNLEAAIRQCEGAGADQIHMDIMDGVFVPNISMGPAVVAMANRVTELPMDVHLMLLQPQNHIEAFAKAGSDTILIHIEANCDIEGTLKKIRDLGCKAGITVNPPTALDQIFQGSEKDRKPSCNDFQGSEKNRGAGSSCFQCLEKGLVDEVLIMSVNPGFGGQKYIADAENKVAEIRRRFPELLISIDGGIDLETVKPAAAHGANLFVAGTSLFKAPDMKTAIAQMRANAEAAYATRL